MSPLKLKKYGVTSWCFSSPLDADTDHGLGGCGGVSNGGGICYDGGGSGGSGGGNNSSGGAMDMNAAIFDDLGKLDDPMLKLLDGCVSGVDEMTEEHLKS